MVRLTFLMMLVVVGVAWADEEGCTSQDDCDCGSVCNNGACEAGCMVYDTFMAAGAESDVYGRLCQCSADPDADGRPIMCAEDKDFVGAPEGVKMYAPNIKCTPAAADAADAAPAADDAPAVDDTPIA